MPPLIEEATRRPDVTSLAWIIALVAIVCLVFAALAPVWPGTRRVVTGRGRVRRVFESGIAWRIPVLERFGVVISGEHDMPLEIIATTVEGHSVLIEAEVAIRLDAPIVGQAHLDPWAAAEPYASEVISDLVATRSMTELPLALRAAKGKFRTSIATQADPPGVDVLGVEIVAIQPALPIKPSP